MPPTPHRRPMETPGDPVGPWKSGVFKVSWILYLSIWVLRVPSASMTFLTLLASFLVKELLKMVGWRQFWTKFCLFSTILEKSSPQFPNSCRTSRSHMASQAKGLCGKWSHTGPLIMSFLKKKKHHRGSKTLDFP